MSLSIIYLAIGTMTPVTWQNDCDLSILSEILKRHASHLKWLTNERLPAHHIILNLLQKCKWYWLVVGSIISKASIILCEGVQYSIAEWL